MYIYIYMYMYIYIYIYVYIHIYIEDACGGTSPPPPTSCTSPCIVVGCVTLLARYSPGMAAVTATVKVTWGAVHCGRRWKENCRKHIWKCKWKVYEKSTERFTKKQEMQPKCIKNRVPRPIQGQVGIGTMDFATVVRFWKEKAWIIVQLYVFIQKNIKPLK